jgi:hypothetical protein
MAYRIEVLAAGEHVLHLHEDHRAIEEQYRSVFHSRLQGHLLCDELVIQASNTSSFSLLPFESGLAGPGEIWSERRFSQYLSTALASYRLNPAGQSILSVIH